MHHEEPFRVQHRRNPIDPTETRRNVATNRTHARHVLRQCLMIISGIGPVPRTGQLSTRKGVSEAAGPGMDLRIYFYWKSATRRKGDGGSSGSSRRVLPLRWSSELQRVPHANYKRGPNTRRKRKRKRGAFELYEYEIRGGSCAAEENRSQPRNENW